MGVKPAAKGAVPRGKDGGPPPSLPVSFLSRHHEILKEHFSSSSYSVLTTFLMVGKALSAKLRCIHSSYSLSLGGLF